MKLLSFEQKQTYNNTYTISQPQRGAVLANIKYVNEWMAGGIRQTHLKWVVAAVITRFVSIRATVCAAK